MSTPINTGGPAFPRPSVEITDNDRGYGQSGMTLRDYFAGQALAGVLANPTAQGVAAEDQAGYAYFLADAMIAAR